MVSRRIRGGAQPGPPHFLVLGAMKAGTTSLYAHLTALPGAGAASKKELQYFTYLWDRPLEWYLQQFPAGLVSGEASPQYLFHPRAARRCASVLPDLKLLVLLRDPIDRAYSHYRFEMNRDREPLGTFEEALAAEDERLAPVGVDDMDLRTNPAARWSSRSRGHYAEQLERWLLHYPREQLRVIETGELGGTRAGSSRARRAGWGYPGRGVHRFDRENVGSYESPMTTATRQQLRRHSAPHNERLYDLLGRDLGWS